jgi:amphi-Trp domain-containing protein
MAKKSEKGFHHESLEDGSSISAYLKAVREGFAEGSLRLSDQNGEIVLEPNGLMNFEVNASSRRGRSKLTLTFSWREKPDKDPASGGSLKINGAEEGPPDAVS